MIRNVPDAPLSLANDPTTTTDKVIRFTWADGATDGGSPVIDYTVSYDQGTGTFVQLSQSVTTKYYQTQIALIAGNTYVFRVQSRNTVGLSAESSSLAVLAATLPDTP